MNKNDNIQCLYLINMYQIPCTIVITKKYINNKKKLISYILWIKSNNSRTLLSRPWTIFSRHVFLKTNSVADGMSKREEVHKRSNFKEFAKYPQFVSNPYLWDLLRRTRESAL